MNEQRIVDYLLFEADISDESRVKSRPNLVSHKEITIFVSYLQSTLHVAPYTRSLADGVLIKTV
jgi:hypothetical protein